jgi:hypothetical protein
MYSLRSFCMRLSVKTPSIFKLTASFQVWYHISSKRFRPLRPINAKMSSFRNQDGWTRLRPWW